MSIERIKLNDDGTLDEVVGEGRFHLEQMNDGYWFLDLGGLRLAILSAPVPAPTDPDDGYEWPVYIRHNDGDDLKMIAAQKTQAVNGKGTP